MNKTAFYTFLSISRLKNVVAPLPSLARGGQRCYPTRGSDPANNPSPTPPAGEPQKLNGLGLQGK